MKRVFSILVSVITMVSISLSLSAAQHDFFYTLSSSNNFKKFSTVASVADYNQMWYVYVSYVSFSGMPSGTHPAGYELYFRPYHKTDNIQESDSYLTFSYKASGFANIGQMGDSASYKTNEGYHNAEYRMKSNTGYHSKSQTISAYWIP